MPYVPGGSQQQSPSLDSLVVPDSASEIVAVVSTLAKCYAQRLVAAARRVADAEEVATKFENADDDENEDNEDAETSASEPIKPLQPHHYMEAHQHRVASGIDPGFWMLDTIKKSMKGFVGVACHSTINKHGGLS